MTSQDRVIEGFCDIIGESFSLYATIQLSLVAIGTVVVET